MSEAGRIHISLLFPEMLKTLGGTLLRVFFRIADAIVLQLKTDTGVMRHCIVLTFFLLSAAALQAQNFTLSTNLLDWANLGTVNLQAGLSVGRHLTIMN